MAEQDKAGSTLSPTPRNPQSTGTPQSGRKQDAPEAGVVLGVQSVTGIRSSVESDYTARTSVPGAPGVDARLDNRQGRDRPPLETFPAKPQQIDGPDVAGQVEHTRRTLAELADLGPRKGMFSPGMHGLAAEEVREGHFTPDAVNQESSSKSK